METLSEIMAELKRLQRQLGEVLDNQKNLKADMRMIFFDVTNFENMVLKILDNSASHSLHWDKQESFKDKKGFKH